MQETGFGAEKAGVERALPSSEKLHAAGRGTEMDRRRSTGRAEVFRELLGHKT